MIVSPTNPTKTMLATITLATSAKQRTATLLRGRPCASVVQVAPMPAATMRAALSFSLSLKTANFLDRPDAARPLGQPAVKYSTKLLVYKKRQQRVLGWAV